MQIATNHDGHVTVLSLNGDLVIGEPETLLNRTVARLIEEGRTNILIDLKGVRRLDSSGLGALVRTLKSSQEEGGQTKLLHVGPMIQKLLTITQLASVFESFDDEEKAVLSF